MSIQIRCWRDGAIEESTDVDELARLHASKGSRTWIDLTNPSPDLVQAVGRRLGLHHLLAEDIVERNERAKVQLVGDVIHVVTFLLEREDEVVTQEIDFVLGNGFLLSVHPASWDPLTAHQVKMGLEDILSKGPDLLLWALVDSIVDGYFPVFDRMGDEIDDVQDAAIARAIPATAPMPARITVTPVRRFMIADRLLLIEDRYTSRAPATSSRNESSSSLRRIRWS
jgi:magnesium transporter